MARVGHVKIIELGVERMLTKLRGISLIGLAKHEREREREKEIEGRHKKFAFLIGRFLSSTFLIGRFCFRKLPVAGKPLVDR